MRRRIPLSRFVTLFAVTLGCLFATAYLEVPQASARASETWSPTGEMNTARGEHTATRLTNGLVLVAGGLGPDFTPTSGAELYDPETALWTNTGSMNDARHLHTATLLLDGRVLVCGGLGQDGEPLASSETYDPAAGNWTIVGMKRIPRAGHTATVLSDGQVLVAGGATGAGTAEVFNPKTDSWSDTGPMQDPRIVGHAAAALPNGGVLVAGGRDPSGRTLDTTERFDPETREWFPDARFRDPRQWPGIAELVRALFLFGGAQEGPDRPGRQGSPPVALRSAELYDPDAGTWTPTGDMNDARFFHTGTVLDSGEVLAAGGLGAELNPLSTAELFDPLTGTWRGTGSMGTARESHTATPLPDGRVLAAGGFGSKGEPLASAELYTR